MLIFLQGKLGDLFFDDKRFSRARNVLAQMLRRNVRLVLEISPFISTESSSFSETSRLGLLVKQLGSDIPALTSFKVSLHIRWLWLFKRIPSSPALHICRVLVPFIYVTSSGMKYFLLEEKFLIFFNAQTYCFHVCMNNSQHKGEL